MKTLAIIAEYNPFHNGHAYQLSCAKELTQADYSIAVMGGNFLQRGQAAMWDKFTRAQIAASCGIDLVIELPFPYATGSARDFSMGAVSMLNKFQTVDFLCFGAETDDLPSFLKIANILVNEPDLFKRRLKIYLADGDSYPLARERAMNDYISHQTVQSIDQVTDFNNVHEILSLPNNILALEYICALIRTNSLIKPVLIPRTEALYHDENIHHTICSAKAIRSNIHNLTVNSSVKHALPEVSYSLIKASYQINSPVITDDLSVFLQSARLFNPPDASICDFDEEFIGRLSKLPIAASYLDILDALKSRNWTSGRISRAFIHYLLGYTEEHRTSFLSGGYCFYANILSFRKESSTLIKELHSNSQIPIITKKGDYLSKLHQESFEAALCMWKLDIHATTLYNCMIFNRYHVVCEDDYHKLIPII
ncbi:MAG: nucleotidyltransferase family protein [Eubacteriales bacterium]|nr:nucleotidyltransferase family protein [Eubacteriales bacterium]